MIRGPVFPILPSYHPNQELDIDAIIKYIEWLDVNEVSTIMTTAGTTQFNLLEDWEIRQINRTCQEHFSGNVILGVPPRSTEKTKLWLNEIEAWADKNTIVMVMYPERYYKDITIINFFDDLLANTELNLFIHGLPIKNHDYDERLLSTLFSHKQIVGMKEETSTIDKASDIFSKLNLKDKSIIVAGGSMKRFNALSHTGISGFVSGVGSLCPAIELEYWNRIWNFGDLYGANEIITEYESPLFETFFDIGWHPSLRYGLKHLGLGCEHNRQPFPSLLSGNKEAIKSVIRKTVCQFTS